MFREIMKTSLVKDLIEIGGCDKPARSWVVGD
jgi:hypothetical protein